MSSTKKAAKAASKQASAESKLSIARTEWFGVAERLLRVYKRMNVEEEDQHEDVLEFNTIEKIKGKTAKQLNDMTSTANANIRKLEGQEARRVAKAVEDQRIKEEADATREQALKRVDAFEQQDINTIVVQAVLSEEKVRRSILAQTMAAFCKKTPILRAMHYNSAPNDKYIMTYKKVEWMWQPVVIPGGDDARAQEYANMIYNKMFRNADLDVISEGLQEALGDKKSGRVIEGKISSANALITERQVSRQILDIFLNVLRSKSTEFSTNYKASLETDMFACVTLVFPDGHAVLKTDTKNGANYKVDAEFVEYDAKDLSKGRGSEFFSTDFFIQSSSIKIAKDAYEGNISAALTMDIAALEQIASNIANGNKKLLRDMNNMMVSALTRGEAAKSKVLLALSGAISAGKSTFFKLFFSELNFESKSALECNSKLLKGTAIDKSYESLRASRNPFGISMVPDMDDPMSQAKIMSNLTGLDDGKGQMLTGLKADPCLTVVGCNMDHLPKGISSTAQQKILVYTDLRAKPTGNLLLKSQTASLPIHMFSYVDHPRSVDGKDPAFQSGFVLDTSNFLHAAVTKNGYLKPTRHYLNSTLTFRSSTNELFIIENSKHENLADPDSASAILHDKWVPKSLFSLVSLAEECEGSSMNSGKIKVPVKGDNMLPAYITIGSSIYKLSNDQYAGVATPSPPKRQKMSTLLGSKLKFDDDDHSMDDSESMIKWAKVDKDNYFMIPAGSALVVSGENTEDDTVKFDLYESAPGGVIYIQKDNLAMLLSTHDSRSQHLLTSIQNSTFSDAMTAITFKALAGFKEGTPDSVTKILTGNDPKFVSLNNIKKVIPESHNHTKSEFDANLKAMGEKALSMVCACHIPCRANSWARNKGLGVPLHKALEWMMTKDNQAFVNLFNWLGSTVDITEYDGLGDQVPTVVDFGVNLASCGGQPQKMKPGDRKRAMCLLNYALYETGLWHLKETNDLDKEPKDTEDSKRDLMYFDPNLGNGKYIENCPRYALTVSDQDSLDTSEDKINELMVSNKRVDCYSKIITQMNSMCIRGIVPMVLITDDLYERRIQEFEKVVKMDAEDEAEADPMDCDDPPSPSVIYNNDGSLKDPKGASKGASSSSNQSRAKKPPSGRASGKSKA